MVVPYQMAETNGLCHLKKFLKKQKVGSPEKTDQVQGHEKTGQFNTNW
jgi:hypothetical protein